MGGHPSTGEIVVLKGYMQVGCRCALFGQWDVGNGIVGILVKQLTEIVIYFWLQDVLP